MSRGPNGQKRSADAAGPDASMTNVGNAPEVDDGKDPAAKALGKKGGAARAAKLTPEQRTEIARKAAEKRWNKV